MSDDYHRPTYTTRDVHGAFNATQVRLYGIPGLPALKEITKNDKLADVHTGILDNYALVLARTNLGAAADHEIVQRLKKDVFADQEKGGALGSYVFINSIIKDYMIMLGAINTSRTTVPHPTGRGKPLTPPTSDHIEFSSGIIFGYAYEGHTYDLPKPKIMLIPAPPETKIPKDDSGYDLKIDAGYTVWIVDKLDQCVEFEMNQGFVEQLVLDANLPGKRSPSMYASKMMMAHRSGKLND